MIDRDFITEVCDTIVKQRWRSVMTAFGIFWGILILVVLMGLGQGMQASLYTMYLSLPSNSVIAGSAPTTLPYEGFEVGRQWNMTTADIERLHQTYQSDIRDIALLNLANDGEPVAIKYGEKVIYSPLSGQQPQTLSGFAQKLVDGRFINKIDLIQRRNVCVIGKTMADNLFGEQSPLQQTVEIDNEVFVVVGIAKLFNSNMDIGFNMTEGIAIPFTLMQSIYNQGDAVHICNFILNEDANPDKFAASIDSSIRQWHHLHPDDTNSLEVVSMKKQLQQYKNIFDGIDFLIWTVGIGTLVAGLIGVSNIMIISVKERTKEIGVRSVMGAQPLSIVLQIMCESILLTASSGLVGLCLGVGVLATIDTAIGNGTEFLTHPYMPFWSGIVSLIILVIGGIIAGFIPAKRALNIELVNALSEK